MGRDEGAIIADAADSASEGILHQKLQGLLSAWPPSMMPPMIRSKSLCALAAQAVLVSFALPPPVAGEPAKAPQPRTTPTGYTDTPFIPGRKWRVHDDARPGPPWSRPPKPFAVPQAPR